jgi:hypothetical protein
MYTVQESMPGVLNNLNLGECQTTFVLAITPPPLPTPGKHIYAESPLPDTFYWCI